MDNSELEDNEHSESHNSINTRLKGLEALVDEFDKRFEGVEQMQAILITMYAELWAALEGVYSVISADEELKKQMLEHRQTALNALWEQMGKMPGNFGSTYDDKDKAAMEHFVRGTEDTSDT